MYYVTGWLNQRYKKQKGMIFQRLDIFYSLNPDFSRCLKIVFCIVLFLLHSKTMINSLRLAETVFLFQSSQTCQITFGPCEWLMRHESARASKNVLDDWFFLVHVFLLTIFCTTFPYFNFSILNAYVLLWSVAGSAVTWNSETTIHQTSRSRAEKTFTNK